MVWSGQLLMNTMREGFTKPKQIIVGKLGGIELESILGLIRTTFTHSWRNKDLLGYSYLKDVEIS